MAPRHDLRGPAAEASLLYGVKVPESGGDTSFYSLYHAYDALPQALARRIEALTCKHDATRTSAGTLRAGYEESYSNEERPGAVHPLVIRHPATGRKALYIGNHAVGLHGFSDKEARPLLDYLMQHSVQPEMSCRFRWQVGSMAIWDNRCTMHRALNDYPGKRRRMHRITICGDAPF